MALLYEIGTPPFNEDVFDMSLVFDLPCRVSKLGYGFPGRFASNLGKWRSGSHATQAQQKSPLPCSLLQKLQAHLYMDACMAGCLVNISNFDYYLRLCSISRV